MRTASTPNCLAQMPRLLPVLAWDIFNVCVVMMWLNQNVYYAINNAIHQFGNESFHEKVVLVGFIGMSMLYRVLSGCKFIVCVGMMMRLKSNVSPINNAHISNDYVMNKTGMHYANIQ